MKYTGPISRPPPEAGTPLLQGTACLKLTGNRIHEY